MDGSFWANFWPAFTATIGGVIVGVPVALWIDRHAEQRAALRREEQHRLAEQRRLEEERARTCEVLKQLEPVIRRHAEWFSDLGAWSNLYEYYEGPLEELWKVLRQQIVSTHLSDRRLFGDLAIHFERCGRLDELVRLRATLSLAGPSAQQARVQTELEAIQTRLNSMKNAQDVQPEELAKRVAAEISALGAC